MKYLKTYKIFEAGPDDPRSIPITAEIKATIRDSFRGLEDMIDSDSPQFGVKIGLVRSPRLHLGLQKQWLSAPCIKNTFVFVIAKRCQAQISI